MRNILNLRIMFGLKLLRKLLPPFHPMKYKYINWYYGKQIDNGAWQMNILKKMLNLK